VATNGKRRPPRPRIEILSATSSESEAAAIVAALEQFLADMAPAPRAERSGRRRWQAAALREGVEARQQSARSWGAAASWRDR
jgi:hypothetical protein